jgi:hypothetical protein
MGRPKGSLNSPTRKPLDVRQSTVRRTIKAVQSMGLPIGRIEIDPRSGKITVEVGTAGAMTSLPNPWDTDHAQDQKRSA